MKKYAIYGLSAMMGVAFVACDNYEEPTPAPQANQQGLILQADQVSVASAIDEAGYDLAALSQNGEKILLATVTAPDLGDYYGYKAVVEMSSNGFAKTFEVPSTVEAANEEGTLYNILITPDDLQGLYYANVSKGPKAKVVEARYKLYTESAPDANTHQVARIGGEDNVYGPYSLTVTPFPSNLVIEDSYYLVGTACDWSVASAIKLNHSDASPYDDPVFTCKFDVFEGWWWKIIPESTFVTGDWAPGPNSQYGVEVDGDESLAGVLVAHDGTNEPKAGCLNVTGPYLLTINMEDLTYDFSLAIENLWTPGNSNGWSHGGSQMLYTENYADYYGFAHLNGEFKFTTQPDWNGLAFGMGAEDGKLSTSPEAGNLNAGADGLYYLHINVSALTYQLTNITTIGVIGDATPGGWDASTALTPSADFLTWTGKITFGNGEFKLRCNDSWDINFGGDPNNLATLNNPANIPSPGEGEYLVTLDLSTLPYTVTLQK